MGIPYWRAEFVLDQFAAIRHWGDHGEVMLDDAITDGAHVSPPARPSRSPRVRRRATAVFYRRRRDPSSYVPEHALALVKVSFSCSAIFSHDEVLDIDRGRLPRWSLPHLA